MDAFEVIGQYALDQKYTKVVELKRVINITINGENMLVYVPEIEDMTPGLVEVRQIVDVEDALYIRKPAVISIPVQDTSDEQLLLALGIFRPSITHA